MSADQLLQLVSQVLFVLIFLVVGGRAIRHPRRANYDTALLFGVVAVLVAEGWVARLVGGGTAPSLIVATVDSLLMALPYFLLRLVDDFTELSSVLVRASALGLVLIAIGLFVLKMPYPGMFILLCVAYFVGLAVFVSVAFIRAAWRSRGITRRRMQAVALGSLSLGLVILLAGIQAAAPAMAALWSILADICALVAGLCYYLGFAPPRWLRRTWQEPELWTFLEGAAALPQLHDMAAVVQALEQGAAHALGAPHAIIGLWDEDEGVLYYAGAAGQVRLPPDQTLGGHTFATQQPLFSADAARDDPAAADLYRRSGAKAVLAAPITAGNKRLGVLVIYAARAPLFADDDLALVNLLAAQAAVILESRALIDEAARVRAREEAARLKDDFLSAAAHDLKTPLTALVAQAQLMERRATRNPMAPADPHGITTMVKEAMRLKRLVLELLDVRRVEQGKLQMHLEHLDLADLAREACTRHTSERHHCILTAPEPVWGQFDRFRIQQLIDNLLENAVKYSPGGGEIHLGVEWSEGMARLTVTDTGIGILAADLPHLFERFHRGRNVNDRDFAGLGLGLYICHGIVEQYGGRLWATSPGAGHGSSFHIALPARMETLPAFKEATGALAMLAKTGD